MKNKRRTQPISPTKAVAILIILAIAAFQWYQNSRQPAQQPGIPDWANQSEAAPEVANPASSGDSSSTADARLPNQSKSTRESQSSGHSNTASGTRTFDIAKSSGNSRSKGDTPSNRDPQSTGSVSVDRDSFLQPSGDRNLKSPAGLIYYVGPGGENRVEHVMRHAENDLDRPSHGVFDGDEETILKLLDEAYELIKSKSKYVKSEASQGNTAYTVSLGRRIGYEGGEKGERSGHRALKSVRLILNGNRVITAYPYR